MTKQLIKCLFLLIIVKESLFCFHVTATEIKKDTLQTTKSKEERNVMLNASDANKPREIPIGLPPEDVNVYENGLPVVYSSSLHNVATHWRYESSLSHMELIEPGESAVTTGNIAYSVNSFSQLGSEEFRGLLNYNANHFGLQQFDLNISGNLGKGWLYSGSVYQNFDPGAFDLKFTDFHDRMQLYKGAITRKLNDRGAISFIYKYTNDKNAGDLVTCGPFIYVGDGSVKEVPGFSLGTSSYLPTSGQIKYQDLLTGEILDSNFRDGMEHTAHDISLLGNYQFRNGIKWSFNGKYSRANVQSTNITGTSITDIQNGVEQNTDNVNTYYLNGEPFSGKKQGNTVYYHISAIDNILFTTELSKRSGKHNWRIGLNEWYYWSKYHSNTTMFDFTVEEYPTLITNKTPSGEERIFFNYNAVGSEYNVGYENRLALYFTDEWKPIEKLRLYYGARLEYYRIDGKNLPYTRYEGFHLNDGHIDENGAETLITPVTFTHNNLNYALALQATYNLSSCFGLLADMAYTTSRPRMIDYAASFNPENKAVSIPLLKGGIFLRNNWINLTSMVTYIRKSNNFSLMNLSNPLLNTDTRTVAFNYNIQTIGWTTSAEINPFKNFHLHCLMTLQNPQYKNYDTTVSFGDKTYPVSASDKVVTGISKVLLEIDPSYNITDDLRLWLSFRYFSKQYANLSNALYFNGHWETFAGINYSVNKNLALKLSVVNFLNQTGATGSINGAELITEEEVDNYKNYWMAGNYLRPFTVEFGAKITF